MAARKKAKRARKRKKVTKRKPIGRKKVAKRKVAKKAKKGVAKKTRKKVRAKKKVAKKAKKQVRAKKRVAKKAKKRVAKRAAKKKVTRGTKAPAKKKVAKIAPARAPAKPLTPQPLPDEERVGVVTHYYTHLAVAIVQLDVGVLREGDTVHIKGYTSDFTQKVGSMEIEHVHVGEVRTGQSFGLKVKEHAREHDVVYRVKTP